MPITLNCPKCHKPFRVRDESIGGRVRCPSCGSVLQVPSALSPASNFDEPPKSDIPVEPGGAGRPMAEAVPASSHPGVTAPGRREDLVDLGRAPASQLPGPPSIKAPVPSAPVRSAPPPARPTIPTTLPTAPRSDRHAPAQGPYGPDLAGWGRVRGGLGMVRWAEFLCALVFLGAIGHGVWTALAPDAALKEGPGFLGKEGWPRWKELMVAYTAGPLALASLLFLIGRLRCGGAPPEAHARGLALGAAFFTLIGIVGAALFIGMTYFELGDRLKLPAEVRLTGLYAAVPAIVLAHVFTLLFIGQIGWPLGRPQLQKSVAGLFFYAAALPAAVLIGSQYYPAFATAWEEIKTGGSPFAGDPGDDIGNRIIIWGVVLLAAGALFFLRAAGICGSARRAIGRVLSGEA